MKTQRRLPHERERQKIANAKHRATAKYKERAPLHAKKYRDSDAGKTNRKAYVEAHKSELKEYLEKYSKEWAKTSAGKISLKKAMEKWRAKDPERVRKMHREYYHKRKLKVEYRINDAFSSGIYLALRSKKNGRSWEKLVGFTLTDLMIHLESLFKNGMTWDNYGEWNIDHIIPKSKFTFSSSDDDQFKQCWSLQNLQPLWASENFSKRDKILRS